MLIHHAYRYRIYPNSEQRHKRAVQFGHARYAYNWVLARRKAYDAETSKTLPFYEVSDPSATGPGRSHAIMRRYILARWNNRIGAT